MVHGHSPECCIQSWNSLHESLKHSRNIQLKPIRTIITRICLKGYSIGQIHFSEINVKLAEKNEFATQFVQKLLEMRENRQYVVLNESSEGFRNRSEFVWILVLAMTTANDDASGSYFVGEVAARFQLFYKQTGDFWCLCFGSLKTK